MGLNDAGSLARVLLLGFAVIGLLPVLAYAETEGSSNSGSGIDPSTPGGQDRPSVVCPKTFSPVVCSGRKYWNPCIARASGFADSKCLRPSAVARRPDTGAKTPCLTAADCARPVYCTLEYAPVVCADGKTYSNMCFAKASDQEKCDRIVPSCSTSAADCTPTPIPIACASGAADCPSLVAVDSSTGSEIKAKWLAHISAVKVMHKEYDDKITEVEDGIGAELRNKCKRPQITAEEYYKCLRSDLKPKDVAYWHFSFAALIERAQKLSEYGVPQAEIDAFVSFVKEQSLAFEAASTVEEKRKIVNSVNEAWKEKFRKNAIYWMVGYRIDSVAKKVASILPELKSIQAKLQANGLETARLNKVIAKLEANLAIMTSTDASVTLRQKWIAAHESVQLIKHINRLINAIVNHQPTADIDEVSAVDVPAEVQVAQDISAQVSADIATATPVASIEAEGQAEVVELTAETED